MKAKVKIIKGYLSPDKCAALSKLSLDQIKEGIVGYGSIPENNLRYDETVVRVRTNTRYSSRMYDDVVFSSLVYDVFSKIREDFDLKQAPISRNGGKDGIVFSCTMEGGDVYLHKDPKEGPGVSTLRCNILTSKPDGGGAVCVEDQKFDLDVGDMMCYLVSDHEHCVEQVVGANPRIIWMFGMLVPPWSWNSGTIVYNPKND